MSERSITELIFLYIYYNTDFIYINYFKYLTCMDHFNTLRSKYEIRHKQSEIPLNGLNFVFPYMSNFISLYLKKTNNVTLKRQKKI